MTTETETNELQDLATSVFSDADAEGSGFDAALWSTLEETGLARLTLPEEVGGSGAGFVESAVVLGAAGEFAGRVPLVETDLTAGWLLHTAGIPLPDGPLTLATADLDVDRTARRAAGTLRRVPWARSAAGIVVLAGDAVLLIDPAGVEITDGTNVAEEPRDTVTVDGAITVAGVDDRVGSELRLRGAFGRAALLAGAARGALTAAVQYAGERIQFGRPIGRFQAIQQQLALAAGEVAAAQSAVAVAARKIDRAGFGDAEVQLAVAAAKSRTSEAAGVVARIAHQVHGAIGFTREHRLRLTTTRLWAWRDEDGSEAEWNDLVGRLALEAGPAGLWPMVVGTP
ncbi:acyl-CoA dehydrogenase [Pseudonocardia thermophila]|jgi:Acyl-CoA dehydrogenases|uniref:Acyl-CoA dehydrogenase n=1 Tax=Pseudonocardia thermophila TaxID=1848 RepID=A0A1M6NG94_PSETH|nr:acyl-CoA dehydrogenase [Pseudonocardia thermophila]SHJ94755.1 acyl-CoA dehydrogenase [Pseudonocardia thermophila]